MLLQKLLNPFKRKPDLAIGGWDDPYLLRWYVIPRNDFFNVYLHQFLRDDDDRALHDHPWWFISIILKTGYIEITKDYDIEYLEPINPGNIIFRKAKHRHRVVLYKLDKSLKVHASAWTLVFTGPKVRKWGFWCPQGFVPWEEFTSGENGETIGKGCG